MKKVYLIIFIAVILVVAAAYWSQGKKEVKILFVGDMFFDRQIRKVMYQKDGDFIFSCIGDLTKSVDLAVGNLEGPITENASVSLLSEVGGPDNFTFTFPTNTAALLSKYNFKLVNLGNNHMLNFGRDGLLQTKKYLKEAGVSHFGDPDATEEERVFRLDLHDHRLSFVNWSNWTSDNTDLTAAQIKKEVESGRKVFVYTHWGDEYVPPPARVKRLARSFIDAGAEMVIGSHPHVIQETEIYPSTHSVRSGQAGKHIYYSLGNFIFDQYWNKEVSTGLTLEVQLKGDKISVIERKVSIGRDGRTCLAPEVK